MGNDVGGDDDDEEKKEILKTMLNPPMYVL